MPASPQRRTDRAWRAASTRPRTSRTCSRCSMHRSSPTRCSRSATSRRLRCASTPPGSICAPRRSPRAWTCASSPRAGATRSSAARFRRRRDAIVTTSGTDVGTHDGVDRFTVGQRRGVGVALGDRRYVVEVDAATRTVTVGERHELDARSRATRRGGAARRADRRSARSPRSRARTVHPSSARSTRTTMSCTSPRPSLEWRQDR